MFGSLTTAARSTAARRSVSQVASIRSFTSTRLVANNADPSQEEQITAGEQKIREILSAKFNPAVLKVQDVSGESCFVRNCFMPLPFVLLTSLLIFRVCDSGGCGSFYAIQLSSKEFKGMSTVKAHRLVNQELKDVIKDIHGLQVR